MKFLAVIVLSALVGSCASATSRQRVSRTEVQTQSPGVRWRPRAGPSLEGLLNVHRAWWPSPSRDGSRVMFLSDASGVPEVYETVTGALSRESVWQRRVRSTERVQYVAWSPESGGGRFFFGRDHGGDENTQIFMQGVGETTAQAFTPPGVKTLFGALSADGALVAYSSNERERASFDVYVRAAHGGPARRVVESSGQRTAPAFSRDGRRLAVVESRSNFDQDVFVVDVVAGATTRVSPSVEAPVRYEQPRFSADGTRMFVITDLGREFMNVALLHADRPNEAAPRFVLEEDHDVESIELSPSAELMAVVLNVDGYGSLRLYDVRDPERPVERGRPSLPPGEISSLRFSGDGSWLFAALSRATANTEVYKVELSSGAATRVTESDRGGVDTGRLVEPTVERVRSFDGLEVPVFVYRPKDLGASERAPGVVWVHGGPESQFRPYFNPVIQYLVGHGYLVVAPNVRGSTGYGKRYSHLDDVALREDSVRDLAEVNRWLRGRGDVQSDRIAIVGGSYGGYMVLAAMTLYPELWAAGCDIVGIANFETFLQNTASYRRAIREAEYGSLANDLALLRRISPIHRVERITAPLMVIHGANDPRVPVSEAEQLVTALRGRGRRVEYLRFDDEGHGIVRRPNRLRAYGALVEFFDQVLGAR